jgi:YD repeat-containing protein
MQVVTSGTVANSIQYSYNSDGSLAQISVNGTVATRDYDKDGLLIQAGDESITRSNFGAISASTQGKISETMAYDNFGEATDDKFVFSKQTLLDSSYIRDNLGRITSISKQSIGLDRGRSFTYDAQGRLTTAAQGYFPDREYQYDQNGNRTVMISFGQQINAKYDAQDRLTNYGNIEFQYNANGDLTQKTEHSFAFDDYFSWLHFFSQDKQKITQYSFDMFGNLKTVTFPDGKQIEYVIDGQNRRVGKKINGKLVQGLGHFTASVALRFRKAPGSFPRLN